MKGRSDRFWKIEFEDGSWAPFKGSRSAALRMRFRYTRNPRAVEVTAAEWARLEMQAGKMAAIGRAYDPNLGLPKGKE